MPDGVWAIINSTIILLLFILVIDLTKNIFRKKYYKIENTNKILNTNSNNFRQKYNTEEFKPIFVSTLFFVIFLILALNYLPVGFDVNQFLFYDLELISIVKGSIFISLLNGALYLGLIVQLLKGYEHLNLESKNWVLVVKENIYGPILEEVLYRGIIFNILVSHGYSNTNSSVISSVMFGICNL